MYDKFSGLKQSLQPGDVDFRGNVVHVARTESSDEYADRMAWLSEYKKAMRSAEEMLKDAELQKEAIDLAAENNWSISLSDAEEIVRQRHAENQSYDDMPDGCSRALLFLSLLLLILFFCHYCFSFFSTAMW